MSEIDLRPWQAECTTKALQWLRSNKQPFLVNAAPGAGKTICASVIAKELLDSKEIDRIIVIAPRREVVRQWAKEFKIVTGRPMVKVTGADEEIEDLGIDLCATWHAVKSLLDAFQAVCRSARTLVICDEHHHAAVEAAWGRGAGGAFAEARHVLILSGTPIRSDGKESIWLAHDDHGVINHPEEGTYTLTYGEAVDFGYCRPITFHRHEGKFTVTLPDGENIAVSGTSDTDLSTELRRVSGLQQAIDYYKLACTPKYLADGTPDLNSYQSSVLEWGISKLNDLRLRMPRAAGLVIAPNIPVAEYMAEILEHLDGEKPTIVHNKQANPDAKITAFKENDKRWLVSVAMISEGVDIPRLRILSYLPSAQTELAFRQAMGRVVRNFGPNDDSRAYVVMPTHRIFEEYARRVEDEMSPAAKRQESEPNEKICRVCGAPNPKDALECGECETAFPVQPPRLKSCPECEALNPIASTECQNCGASFKHDFEISLNEALRIGAIIRGMDLDEEEVIEGERIRDSFKKKVLASGDDKIIDLVKKLPEESYGRLKRLLDTDD